MTSTETRLRDALQASAARVRDERLRPLPSEKAKAEHPWRAWLAPLAAAASVVLVIALVLTVTGTLRPPPKPGNATTATTATPNPRYFATFVQTAKTSGIQVRSVATGKVTAYLPTPKSPPKGLQTIDALAAAPDDRTFYAEYGLVSPNLNVTQVRIFSFTITSGGQATP